MPPNDPVKFPGAAVVPARRRPRGSAGPAPPEPGPPGEAGGCPECRRRRVGVRGRRRAWRSWRPGRRRSQMWTAAIAALGGATAIAGRREQVLARHRLQHAHGARGRRRVRGRRRPDRHRAHGHVETSRPGRGPGRALPMRAQLACRVPQEHGRAPGPPEGELRPEEPRPAQLVPASRGHRRGRGSQAAEVTGVRFHDGIFEVYIGNDYTSVESIKSFISRRRSWPR